MADIFGMEKVKEIKRSVDIAPTMREYLVFAEWAGQERKLTEHGCNFW